MVDKNLWQMWPLCDNSNKMTALYAKVQMNLNRIMVNERTRKVVTRKIQKACHTSWLSPGESSEEYKRRLPVLTTLKALVKIITMLLLRVN